MSVAVLLAFVAAACKSSVKGGQDTGSDPTSDAGSDDDAAVAVAADSESPSGGAVDAAADATGDRAAARDAPGQCLATGPSDAGAACNQFPITGPILGTQPLSVDDAGTANGPTGGAVGDGDYDLVGWLSAFQNYSRRSIHVFNGGTHIEWVAELDGSSPTMVIRANTRTTFAGSVLTIAGVDCMSNGLFLTQSYGYTASGDDLVLYNTDMNTGALQNIYTYRRTCARGP